MLKVFTAFCVLATGGTFSDCLRGSSILYHQNPLDIRYSPPAHLVSFPCYSQLLSLLEILVRQEHAWLPHCPLG